MRDTSSGPHNRAARENDRTHAIHQGTLALSINYTLTFAGANLTINTRAVTITADAKTKIYGESDPALTYQITSGSLASGDSFSGALSRAAGENVGLHAINQGTVALSSNYTLSFAGANLEITARAVTVTADAKTKSYGESDPALTYHITGGSLAGSDAFSGALARDAGENVGSYAIHQGTLALSGNYNLTFAGANLTITQRALTVTADDKTKVYGAANPGFTGTLTGLKSGDNITATYSSAATASSPVGAYPIVPALVDPNSKLGNYSVTINDGTLTVTKASLTVTAGDAAREYGAANPSFTGTVTGVENGDTITATYSSAAAAASPVGAYPIALALVDPDSKLGNYSVTIKNGTLTINNATPVITWSNPAGITYGTALNGGQLNQTANVGGTFTYTPASGTVLGAGNNQNLRADFVPSDSANYSNASKDVKINVSKATLTVAADAKLKIYGAAMPELTASFSGFVNGDTLAASVTGSPSLATTATASCAVGSYPIAATQGTLAAANYGFSFVNGTLAVTKAGTTTSVISSLNPSNLGQPVTFTATVSNGGATLTGTVQFKIDGANFGLPVALS